MVNVEIWARSRGHVCVSMVPYRSCLKESDSNDGVESRDIYLVYEVLFVILSGATFSSLQL